MKKFDELQGHPTGILIIIYDLKCIAMQCNVMQCNARSSNRWHVWTRSTALPDLPYAAHRGGFTIGGVVARAARRSGVTAGVGSVAHE